jgi:hypothetical protein
VANHVRKILKKMGLRSKAQIGTSPGSNLTGSTYPLPNRFLAKAGLATVGLAHQRREQKILAEQRRVSSPNERKLLADEN